MTQFFVPANIQSTGLQKIGSHIILLDQNDKLLLGASSTPWPTFRLCLVGDGGVGGLLLTNAAQDKLSAMSLIGDDLVITGHTTGQIRFTIGSVDALRILPTQEILAGGHSSVPSPSIGVPIGFCHTDGFFVIPTVGNDSQFGGLYIADEKVRLIASKQAGVVPNSELEIIIDGTVVASFTAGNGGDLHGLPLTNVGAGVDATDVARMDQVTAKATVASTDGSGRPRVTVSDSPTDEYHAINRNYLEDNSVARRCVVREVFADGNVLVSDEVLVSTAGIQITLTLPAASTMLGRRLTFKKPNTPGIFSIVKSGTDTIDHLGQYNLVAQNSFVEMIATETASVFRWLTIGGNGVLA